MARVLRIALVASVLLSTRSVSAEPSSLLKRAELSGFLGAHFFSDQSTLGARAGNRASISNSIALGPRFTYLMGPWFALEGEFPIVATNARDTSEDVTVFVFEPRALARFESRRFNNLQPFGTAGLGLPISLSTNRQIIKNDATVQFYVGGGVQVLRDSKWNLRVDTRLFVVPERGDGLVTAEFEMSVGLFRTFGRTGQGPRPSGWFEVADTDGDQVDDDRDDCPDRDEDLDGYKDDDGCPDIDNDFDLVLDIADTCPMEPEDHNGYQDEDGCPDAVPEEITAIVGTIKGVTFGSRSARLRSRSRRRLRKLAKLLVKHDSVRIVITGYADNREEREDDNAISLKRAKAVRDYLVRLKVDRWRIKVEGYGTRNPIGNNRSRRGRRKNRRVELSLRVYGPE